MTAKKKIEEDKFKLNAAIKKAEAIAFQLQGKNEKNLIKERYYNKIGKILIALGNFTRPGTKKITKKDLSKLITVCQFTEKELKTEPKTK